MWARRCGAPPKWPSRVRIAIQSFLILGVGITLYRFATNADAGYLDLSAPRTESVLCLSSWPLRHETDSWWEATAYTDWSKSRFDMQQYIDEHRCLLEGTQASQGLTASATNATCSAANIPLSSLHRHLGYPLGHSNWNSDVVEIYSHLFLYLSVCLWQSVLFHDMALVSQSYNMHPLDLVGARNHFPCVKNALVVATGFRCMRRLLFRSPKMCGRSPSRQRLGFVIAILLTPVFVVWAAMAFVIWYPFAGVVYFLHPIRLSRLGAFTNCVIFSIFGIVLTVHSIVFLSVSRLRPSYAITWPVSLTGSSSPGCYCGCVFAITESGCWQLLLLGVGVTYQMLLLGFQCLKGLRRANWANLMSIKFPVPVTAWEVRWTQPDGGPILNRKAGQPVQGELAFDPFALMDEQPESRETTVLLKPTFREGYGPENSGAQSGSGDHIGCCGFPCQTRVREESDDGDEAKEAGDSVRSAADAKGKAKVNSVYSI